MGEVMPQCFRRRPCLSGSQSRKGWAAALGVATERKRRRGESQPRGHAHPAPASPPLPLRWLSALFCFLLCPRVVPKHGHSNFLELWLDSCWIPESVFHLTIRAKCGKRVLAKTTVINTVSPELITYQTLNIHCASLYMPVNFENSAVATGLEKVSFHSNPKEGQCPRMFKLPHNCIHLTC